MRKSARTVLCGGVPSDWYPYRDTQVVFRTSLSVDSHPKDAIAVLRTFGEPDSTEAAEFAAQDRGLLWGAIQVGRALELR